MFLWQIPTLTGWYLSREDAMNLYQKNYYLLSTWIDYEESVRYVFAILWLLLIFRIAKLDFNYYKRH